MTATTIALEVLLIVLLLIVTVIALSCTVTILFIRVAKLSAAQVGADTGKRGGKKALRPSAFSYRDEETEAFSNSKGREVVCTE